jgi:hypothetical protein
MSRGSLTGAGTRNPGDLINGMCAIGAYWDDASLLSVCQLEERVRELAH